MNKRKFVIAAVAVTAIVVIVVIVCLLNIKKADNSETKEEPSYYLLSSPSNILCPEATNTAYLVFYIISYLCEKAQLFWAGLFRQTENFKSHKNIRLEVPHFITYFNLFQLKSKSISIRY